MKDKDVKIKWKNEKIEDTALEILLTKTIARYSVYLMKRLLRYIELSRKKNRNDSEIVNDFIEIFKGDIAHNAKKLD